MAGGQHRHGDAGDSRDQHDRERQPTPADCREELAHIPNDAVDHPVLTEHVPLPRVRGLAERAPQPVVDEQPQQGGGGGLGVSSREQQSAVAVEYRSPTPPTSLATIASPTAIASRITYGKDSAQDVNRNMSAPRSTGSARQRSPRNRTARADAARGRARSSSVRAAALRRRSPAGRPGRRASTAENASISVSTPFPGRSWVSVQITGPRPERGELETRAVRRVARRRPMPLWTTRTAGQIRPTPNRASASQTASANRKRRQPAFRLAVQGRARDSRSKNPAKA